VLKYGLMQAVAGAEDLFISKHLLVWVRLLLLLLIQFDFTDVYMLGGWLGWDRDSIGKDKII
jgi:hypothetical protein